MLYKLYPQADNMRLFIEPYSREILPYRTEKEMQTRYPGGAFTVIGEIGNLTRLCAGQDRLLAEDKTEIPVFPRGSLFPPFEWVAGYVRVGEAVYIAAVKSLIPSFFLRWRQSRRTRPEGNIHQDRGEKR